MNKIGTVSLKVPGHRVVASDGSEVALFCKMFPAYVRPYRYWLRTKIVGDGLGVTPPAVIPYSMRGVCVPVPSDQQQVEVDDVTGDEFLARYGTVGVLDSLVPDDTAEVDVGIPGDSQVGMGPVQQDTFFKRQKALGLPRNGVFADAALVLMADEFSTDGKIRAPFEQPSMLAFGMTVDNITAQIDWGDHIFGDAGDLGELQRIIWNEMGRFSDTTMLSGQGGLATNVKKWLQEGYMEAGHQVDQSLVCWTWITVMANVYEPSLGTHVSVY